MTTMVAKYGKRGGDVVEDMVVAVMRRAGDHYVAVRGAQIDKIMKLRVELEGSYAKLMRIGDDSSGGRLDVEADLKAITRKYEELDKAIADASSPVEPVKLPRSETDKLAGDMADGLKGKGGKPMKPFKEQDTQGSGRDISEDFQGRQWQVARG